VHDTLDNCLKLKHRCRSVFCILAAFVEVWRILCFVVEGWRIRDSGGLAIKSN
jgi:hypothetical protein